MTGAATVQVRRASIHDAVRIAQHRYPGETGEHLGVYAAWLPDVLSAGTYLGWLATHEDRVIGGAGLILLHWGPGRDTPGPWRGRVVNVYVEPPYRCQGLAGRLLTHVYQDARDRGVRMLNLGTTPAARTLYEAHGFQPSATEMWLALDHPAAP